VHAPDWARFCPHHKCVPILRQGYFSSETDCASRKSKAKCAHNSPPVAASQHGQYASNGGFLKLPVLWCPDALNGRLSLAE
jgi:hypothetical protein